MNFLTPRGGKYAQLEVYASHIFMLENKKRAPRSNSSSKEQAGSGEQSASVSGGGARGGGCLGCGTRMQSGCRRRGDKTWRGIAAPRFSDQSGAMRLSPHRRAETLHQSREGEGRLFVRLPFVFLTSPRSQLTSPVKGRVNLFLVNIVRLCVVSSTIIKEK